MSARARNRARGGGSVWTPAALYAAGEPGLWYDPSVLSSLAQDSAGTTPVTAAGQPVGRIADLSGRGNHGTQSTTASKPTWDGAGIALDGIDDTLSIGNSITVANVDLQISACIRTPVQSSGTRVIVARGGVTHGIALAIVGGCVRASIRRSNTLTSVTGPTRVDTGASVVIGCTLTAAALTVRIDGVDDATVAAAQLASSPSEGGDVGADTGTVVDTNGIFNGAIRGLVIVSRTLTAAEQQRLYQWLAARG